MPLPFESQVAIFYAASQGAFASFPVTEVREAQEQFLDHLTKLHEKDILGPIRESGEMSKEIEAALQKAITTFTTR
jgi:F0F1-type ATP synthase alpha subunit